MGLLSGLAAEVDVEQVHALLLARTPGILEPGHPDAALYEQTVKGVASEVVATVGSDPEGNTRDMALWCIALGTAAHLEAALFPEQQLGEQGRAQQLTQRYLGVLAELRRVPGAGAPDQPVPTGSFPDAPCYPDPALPVAPIIYRW